MLEEKEEKEEKEDEKDELDVVVTTMLPPKEPDLSSPVCSIHHLKEEWWENEKKVMETLQKENERVEKTLEPALPGVNTLLRKAVKIDSKVARVSVSSTWCSSVVFERGVRARRPMPQRNHSKSNVRMQKGIMTKTRTSTLEHRYHSARA